MRTGAIVLGVFALAACGRSPEAEPGEARTEAVSPRAASPLERNMAPDVAVTSAPGVAFNYRYAFRLPAARVGAVQERHAQACEALGLARCRITAMLYRVRSADDVEASLSFKLAPADARAFGKAGVAEVAKAQGMLVESEITGEDVGQKLADGDRDTAAIAAEQIRIEQALARKPPRDPSRADDAQRLAALQDQLRANRGAQAQGREALARTPVTFTYGSGRLVPGFDDRSPILSALDQAGRNIVAGLAVLVLLVGTLLPWLALALLALLGWRLVRAPLTRWWRPRAEP